MSERNYIEARGFMERAIVGLNQADCAEKVLNKDWHRKVMESLDECACQLRCATECLAELIDSARVNGGGQ